MGSSSNGKGRPRAPWSDFRRCKGWKKWKKCFSNVEYERDFLTLISHCVHFKLNQNVISPFHFNLGFTVKTFLSKSSLFRTRSTLWTQATSPTGTKVLYRTSIWPWSATTSWPRSSRPPDVRPKPAPVSLLWCRMSGTTQTAWWPIQQSWNWPPLSTFCFYKKSRWKFIFVLFATKNEHNLMLRLKFNK